MAGGLLWKDSCARHWQQVTPAMRLGALVLLHGFVTASALPVRLPVSAYDVTWQDPTYPGQEFGTASLPVGNGDAAANIWWDQGSLYALLAKGDAWSEWHDLLKLGRLKLTLQPTPSEGSSFSLTMHVATASVALRMEGLVSSHHWRDTPS